MLSHFFYCDQDKGQCFTSTKGLSTFIVICGVLGYAYAKSQTHSEDHNEFLVVFDNEEEFEDNLENVLKPRLD